VIGTQKQLDHPDANRRVATHADTSVDRSTSDEAAPSVYMAYWQARSGFFNVSPKMTPVTKAPTNGIGL
jgi:hypothetical protein